MTHIPESHQHYLVAVEQHPSFARVMEGMGVFGVEAPANDEYDLRELVADFLTYQAGHSPETAVELSRSIVPVVDHYQEACITEKLALKVAPPLAARALDYYMFEGSFDDMRGLLRAYDSTTQSIPGVTSREATAALQRETALRSALAADQVSMLERSDLRSRRFSYGLGVMVSQSAISRETHTKRLKEAGVKPRGVFAREPR